MKKYRLLILGRKTTKDDWDLNNSDECYHMLSIFLYDRFKKLDNVEVYREHIWHPKRDGYDYSSLPEVDFIVFIGHGDTWNEIDFDKLKYNTKYKKIVSVFAEIGLSQDLSIIFVPGTKPNETYINAPCAKEIYNVIKKESKSVLVDHFGGGNVADKTYEIERWLGEEEIRNAFKLYRQVQLGDIENNEMLDKVPKYFYPIVQTGFLDYLNKTDKIENYIITHLESFGYSVIDMLMRKTRIISPKGFLGDWFTKNFHVEEFNSKSELFSILKSEPNPEILEENRNKCNDYDKIVEVVNDYFVQR